MRNYAMKRVGIAPMMRRMMNPVTAAGPSAFCS
jgi:hypothetical protein